MRPRLLILFLTLCLVFGTEFTQQANKLRDPKAIQASLLSEGILYQNRIARRLADKNDTATPPHDSVKCDSQPLLINKIGPGFPEEALADRLHGEVIVRMWVDTAGVVKQVRLQKSEEDAFIPNAITGAFKWRFKPALRSGRPVDVWITVPFRFGVMP